jgi:aryl-alcohol dehydrogenase-like predicted oxidoreductase
MEYRLLGRTNLKVSAIAIGTWQLSGPLLLNGHHDGYPEIGQDRAVNLIRACEDLGINLIDSAEIYGAGEGEKRVGEAIRGRRDRWILSTKFGIRCGENNKRVVSANPDTITSSLEDSLRRLQTDYVDIYLYHTDPALELIDEGREVLETLKQEGKLRFYGISTNNEAVLKQLIQKNAVDVAMFSQSLLTYPSKMLNLVKEHNLGALIRGSLQGGLLSGKYFHLEPTFETDDIRRYSLNSLDARQYAVFEKYVPGSASMVALALRYLLDFDTTHSIVLGGKDLVDYQRALQAFELNAVNSETRIAIEKIRRAYTLSQLKQKILAKVSNLFAK